MSWHDKDWKIKEKIKEGIEQQLDIKEAQDVKPIAVKEPIAEAKPQSTPTANPVKTESINEPKLEIKKAQEVDLSTLNLNATGVKPAVDDVKPSAATPTIKGGRDKNRYNAYMRNYLKTYRAAVKKGVRKVKSHKK